MNFKIGHGLVIELVEQSNLFSPNVKQEGGSFVRPLHATDNTNIIRFLSVLNGEKNTKITIH